MDDFGLDARVHRSCNARKSDQSSKNGYQDKRVRFGAKYINDGTVDEINLVFQPNKEFYRILLCLVMNVQRFLHVLYLLCAIKNP